MPYHALISKKVLLEAEKRGHERYDLGEVTGGALVFSSPSSRIILASHSDRKRISSNQQVIKKEPA